MTEDHWKSATVSRTARKLPKVMHTCVCVIIHVYTSSRSFMPSSLYEWIYLNAISTNDTQGLAFAESKERWGSYCRENDLEYPSGIPKAKAKHFTLPTDFCSRLRSCQCFTCTPENLQYLIQNIDSGCKDGQWEAHTEHCGYQLMNWTIGKMNIVALHIQLWVSDQRWSVLAVLDAVLLQ